MLARYDNEVGNIDLLSPIFYYISTISHFISMMIFSERKANRLSMSEMWWWLTEWVFWERALAIGTTKRIAVVSVLYV